MQRKPLATPVLGRFQRFADCWMPRCYPRLPWMACLWILGALLSSDGVAASDNKPDFRIGFSVRAFTNVNSNDALAAVKVWAEVIARERGILVSPSPRVLKGVDEIRQALINQEIDALALPTDEAWLLRDLMDPRVYIGDGKGGEIFEEYVLLVHQDSDLQRLDDLRGVSINFMQSSRMSLAPIWLDWAGQRILPGRPPPQPFQGPAARLFSADRRLRGDPPQLPDHGRTQSPDQPTLEGARLLT
jgi:hypothetical protein